MEPLKSNTTNKSKLIDCQFTISELDLISSSLVCMNRINNEYLEWKKDDFSQQEIPKEINKTIELYHKIHSYRTKL